MNKTYNLIDSGSNRKLEQFGPYLIDRPSLGSIWQPRLNEASWKKANASFTREGEKTGWKGIEKLPASWIIEVEGIHFKISPTDFGHLGIFPEQKHNWRFIQERVKLAKRPIQVLNLFAYSGGSTLAAALAGASVCHLDASKPMVAWAKENAAINRLEKAPIRWIVDDVTKFLRREIKRGNKYDAIILDPPSFGRGTDGEVFKIEEHLPFILEACRTLLSDRPEFMLLTCHTLGFTPLCLEYLLSDVMKGFSGSIETGEMVLSGDKKALPLPSGAFARWVST